MKLELEIMIDRFYYGFQWVPRASLTSSTRGCTEFHHRLKTSSNRYYDEGSCICGGLISPIYNQSSWMRRLYRSVAKSRNFLGTYLKSGPKSITSGHRVIHQKDDWQNWITRRVSYRDSCACSSPIALWPNRIELLKARGVPVWKI
jgi:hypothetical protein